MNIRTQWPHCRLIRIVKKLCHQFIAHLDTSPDMSGKDVNPMYRFVSGGDIILNKGIMLSFHAAMFPELNDYVLGQGTGCY